MAAALGTNQAPHGTGRRVNVDDDDAAGLGDVAGNLEGHWAGGRNRRPGHREDRVEDTGYAPYGMSVGDLVMAQAGFTRRARERISGVGADQYDGENAQAFEDMDIPRIVSELRAELLDAVNYLTFIDIHMERWFKRWQANG